VDLTLAPEEEAVRDAIRGVLADRSPLTRVRAVMREEPPVDAALWREAGTLGWFGLGVPEDAGGAGYGLPEAMLLFVELGRALAPGPWLGTTLAARALAGETALADAHAAVLGGGLRVAVVDDPADALGRGPALSGHVTGVADASGAALLVLGRRDVRWVAADARGLAVASRPSMDPTRRLARVRFEAVAAVPLGADAGTLRRAGTVLAAAEAVGVAERALEMSVAHATVRRQFGKPIGAFQAVKHRCADMAVRAEVARSVVSFAAVAVRDGDPEAAHHVHVAKTLAAAGAIANATDNVQNHGGMGYTWEGDAHLYLKRAWVLEHAFGARAAHLDALAAPWRAGSGALR
jgi:alkylation response protein AidB-like acyl-CoA dehydrogenase